MLSGLLQSSFLQHFPGLLSLPGKFLSLFQVDEEMQEGNMSLLGELIPELFGLGLFVALLVWRQEISPAICFARSGWQYLRGPGLVRLIGTCILAISLQDGY